MWTPSTKTGTQILLLGILTLGSVACSSDTPNNPPSPTASPVPKSQAAPTATATPAVKTVASNTGNKALATADRLGKKPPKTIDSTGKKPLPEPGALANQPTDENYAKAIDIATGAVNISKSAVSRDDWNLVASQWQEAINLLKEVPTSSPQHATAQAKVAQYQRFLSEAKVRSTPVAKKANQGNSDTNPEFFSLPIKGRAGGTPIVELNFRGATGTRKFEMLFDTGATNTLITMSMAYALRLKRAGFTKSTIADGSQVVLPVAYLQSIESDGRLKRKMLVAIAPPAMPIGLLGQDFYEGYDIFIKENVIEFRRR
jgi:predicted aspartyl protease